MKQLYIASVCMMIGISSLSAQSDIVSDTSVIYPSLKSFVLRGGLDTAGRTIALITQLNLIDSAGKDYGVFVFRTLSSESTPYIYTRNFGDAAITIFTKYHIDSVLQNLSAYFEFNKVHFTYRQRLQCTRLVLAVLEEKIHH